VGLAARAPEVHVTGVDISRDMVERARSLTTTSGVADRVEFHVGDVAALSFPDASFDVVVSTFSLHHWSDPADGLAEIYRVLRPGGVAVVYDLVDWVQGFGHGRASIAELVQASPLGDRQAWTRRITVKFGPIPLVYRAELRRDHLRATRGGVG
jgi:SAM-dependent methyltransferase